MNVSSPEISAATMAKLGQTRLVGVEILAIVARQLFGLFDATPT
jgi:hypothetical protein